MSSSALLDGYCLPISLSQDVAGLSGETVLRGSFSAQTRGSWWFLHPACRHPTRQSPCVWPSGKAKSWWNRRRSASMCLPPWNSSLKSGGPREQTPAVLPFIHHAANIYWESTPSGMDLGAELTVVGKTRPSFSSHRGYYLVVSHTN